MSAPASPARSRRLATLSAALFLGVLAPVVPIGAAAPAQAAGLPRERTWLADTNRALAGSRTYVAHRVDQEVAKGARSGWTAGGRRLALNFDIDNTALRSRYRPGVAVPASLRLAKYAQSRGVAVLFNSGRNVSQRPATIRLLAAAGFPRNGLCLKATGESLRHSKQECRDSFVHNGFTLIENIGNRSTDFAGTGYERAFRLPNYGNRLA